MRIREETAEDAEAIRDVTGAAFAGAAHASGAEAGIVHALRAAGALTLSLVADDGGMILGHAAFSAVTIDGAQDWFGLGPVSVRPDRQGQGIGAALIRAGLSRLRDSGAEGCVVLGDPGYYRRFGFRADPDLSFEGAAPEYFMCLAFRGRAPAGRVTYQPAFHG